MSKENLQQLPVSEKNEKQDGTEQTIENPYDVRNDITKILPWVPHQEMIKRFSTASEQQISENARDITIYDLAKERKKRKKKLTRRGFITLTAATLALNAVKYTWDYYQVGQLIDYLQGKEINSPLDRDTINYNPNTVQNRIRLAIGDSDSGHSDIKQRNPTDFHPPDKFIIDKMLDAKPDLNWQLVYLAKNGTDEDQIQKQLDLPVAQIALGRNVRFENISEEDRKREVLFYLTENSHEDLERLLAEKNPSKVLPRKPRISRELPQALLQKREMYALKIESQEDIERLKVIFESAQAVDITKSSGGNNITNYLEDNPVYKELVDTVTRDPKSLHGFDGGQKIIKLVEGLLPIIASKKRRFYHKVQAINTENLKSNQRIVENIIDIKVPDISRQDSIVMKEHDKSGNVYYKSEVVSKEGITRALMKILPEALNDTEAKAYKEYLEEIFFKQRSTFNGIRLVASLQIYQQHYTPEGYEEMAINEMKRSKIEELTLWQIYEDWKSQNKKD